MMRINILLALSLLLSTIFAEDNVALKFQSFEIVPDVFTEVPKNLIEVGVKYPSGVEVNYGEELTPTDVKDPPSVTWPANPDNYYTLIMTDPDAPSRKDRKFGEIKHWMVVNIPGNNLNAGETIAEYIGSGPPKDTDLHRYIFLVFMQPEKIDFSHEEKSDIRSVKNRIFFSSQDFSEKYSLHLIGGNFYQAQYDDYVPILTAQFREK